MNQGPTPIRIAIFETETAPDASLALPVQRAAAILGQTDHLQLWMNPDRSATRDLDLMVVSQLTPAEISAAMRTDWRRQFPLARQVTVWGPWCMGGLRNGYPDPGTTYVSWLSWPWQIQIFLRQLSEKQPTLWDLPATRSSTERLALAASSGVATKPVGSIRKDGSTSAIPLDLIPSGTGTGLALHEACTYSDWRPRVWPSVSDLVRAPKSERASLWIWEPDVPQVSLPEIVRQRRQLSGSGIILLGFAEILGANDAQTDTQTIQGLNQALSAEEKTVLLPKPFLVSELQAAICDLSFQNGGCSDGFQSFHDIDHQ